MSPRGKQTTHTILIFVTIILTVAGIVYAAGDKLATKDYVRGYVQDTVGEQLKRVEKNQDDQSNDIKRILSKVGAEQ